MIADGTTIDGASGFHSAASVTRTGTTGNGGATVTGLSQTSDLFAGMVVTGTGIPGYPSNNPTIITAVNSSSQVTLSAAATASGSASLTFANKGCAWTQGMVDAIAGINAYSLWDLKWRTACADPRGMALVGGKFWADIYLAGVNIGPPAAGQTIASGASPPKIPTLYGGTGANSYSSLTRWEAAELVEGYGKDLPKYQDFSALAWGTTENLSAGSVPSTTGHAAGFTSVWGCEQVTGNVWIWGGDLGGPYAGATSTPEPDGRGYTSTLT